jgi:flagella basal body P-ring formation protein FlgA
LSRKCSKRARVELKRHAELSNWVEPTFEVEVVRNARPIGACDAAPRVTAQDVRSPARMRFVAICPDAGGWRYEFVTRAKISARVAIAANDLSSGKMLATEDLLLERHDITGTPDAYGDLTGLQDMATRRTIRAGTVIAAKHADGANARQARRGGAHRGQTRPDRSQHGREALDGTGARGAMIGVKNASGVVIRARVTDQGQVEPVD